MKTGDEITSPRCALCMVTGMCPKTATREALVLTESIKDNILAAGYDKIKKGILLLPKDCNAYVNKQKETLSIKCASITQDVQYLSGGNKQKVVSVNGSAATAIILILDCPTRGVDIGVKAAMYQLIYQMKKRRKVYRHYLRGASGADRHERPADYLKGRQPVGEFFRSEKAQ